MREPGRFEELKLDRALQPARTRGIAIVSAAATEGHGYHLPLTTDTLLAGHISNAMSWTAFFALPSWLLYLTSVAIFIVGSVRKLAPKLSD